MYHIKMVETLNTRDMPGSNPAHGLFWGVFVCVFSRSDKGAMFCTP